MDLDRMVEQLAFGHSMPKINSCLGLYISVDALFVSEVRLSGGRPVVEHLLRVPLTQGGPPRTETRAAGTLNTELLTDTEKLSGVLKPVMTQVKWGSHFVVVTLSHHFGLLRYFVTPAFERRFWNSVVPAEAKKYIPIPFGDLMSDFQVLPLAPTADRKSRQGVLFGVTHRKNLEGIKALTQKLGLTVVGVELSPCSVERLWDSVEARSPGAPYAQVHFEGSKVRVLLSENSMPIFFREVQIGPEARVADSRKVDLPGCVDFARKQLGAQMPAQVRLSGATPDLAVWKDTLTQELGVPVQPQDAAKALGLKAGEWGGYASIGAALRPLAKSALNLDLAPSDRVTEEEKRAVYAIFSFMALVAGILLAAGGWRFANGWMKSSELARLQAQGGTLQSFKGKTANEIQLMLKSMEEQTSGAYGLIGPRIRLTHILEDLAEDVPESLWITNIAYDSPVTVTPSGGLGLSRSLSLTGKAMGSNPAAEQDIAIQFQQSLQMDERFGKAFVCGGINVKVQAGSLVPNEGAVDPKQLEEILERRTSFSIGCSGKKS